MANELVIATSLAIVAIVVFHKYSSRKTTRSLPPGPPPIIIAGNALQIPQTEPWVWCGSLKQTYGDVVHLSIFGKPMIILNSFSAINEFFVKKSKIHSDRPPSVMVGEIMGVDKASSLAPYGDYWRLHRRLWTNYLGASSINHYSELMALEAKALPPRLINATKDTFTETRLTVVKLLLGIAYGMKVDSLEDEFVVRTDRSTHEIVDAFTPGKYLVEVLPFLKVVPAWFPGAHWKRLALDVRARMHSMVDEPYFKLKKALANGEPLPRSLTQAMLEQPLSDDNVQKWVGGTVYGGGADTTHSAINRFLVLMVLHPDIQRKGQEELDRVVGRNRLPTIKDKDSLPYIEAVLKELLRWNIIAPFGIPHASTEDDVYNGYHIPKGSLILPNSWMISQDAEMYPDPDDFRPERFLCPEGTTAPMDPRLFAFGYGRRQCPGRHFAEMALFYTITTILATCIVSKPVDDKGNEYEPHVKFSGLSLREMEPFTVRVQPRSDDALSLLKSTINP